MDFRCAVLRAYLQGAEYRDGDYVSGDCSPNGAQAADTSLTQRYTKNAIRAIIFKLTDRNELELKDKGKKKPAAIVG